MKTYQIVSMLHRLHPTVIATSNSPVHAEMIVQSLNTTNQNTDISYTVSETEAEEKKGLQGRSTFWTYEACLEESKKYKTQREFRSGSNVAYIKSYKNGWLADYTWLANDIQHHKPRRYFYNYENCKAMAEDCNNPTELQKKCGSAYNVAYKNGWLAKIFEGKGYKPMTHQPYKFEECLVEAKKYKTKGEFANNSPLLYRASYYHGWLKKFTWLKHTHKWTKETCHNEALKFTSKTDFRKQSEPAYVVARKNGWLSEYSWLK